MMNAWPIAGSGNNQIGTPIFTVGTLRGRLGYMIQTIETILLNFEQRKINRSQLVAAIVVF